MIDDAKYCVTLLGASDTGLNLEKLLLAMARSSLKSPGPAKEIFVE